jgi:hypothetical protein
MAEEAFGLYGGADGLCSKTGIYLFMKIEEKT